MPTQILPNFIQYLYHHTIEVSAPLYKINPNNFNTAEQKYPLDINK
jgi:hypothetical protein